MPKLRRENVPTTLLNHLLDRMRDRDITSDQLGLLADWLDEEPEVPTKSGCIVLMQDVLILVMVVSR